MAILEARPKLELRVVVSLSEGEARALATLFSYGDDEFIRTFKEKLGETHIRDHENDLRGLMKSVRDMMPGIFERMNEARRAFIRTGA